MKKKALLLVSMGVLACTVGVTALAVGGVNQLDRLQVKADPTEYSVTFDKDSTVEAVGNNYAIYETTPSGAKVGVVGHNNKKDDEARFTFNGASFFEFWLYGSETLAEVGANDFDHITGFAISFSGGSMGFIGGLDEDEVVFDAVESEKKYDDRSFTPDDLAGFFTNGDRVVVSSLTIWYSC